MEILGVTLIRNTLDAGAADRITRQQAGLRPVGHREAPPAVGEAAVLEHLEVGDQRLTVVGPHPDQGDAGHRPQAGQGARLLGVEDHQAVRRRGGGELGREARLAQEKIGLQHPGALAALELAPVAVGVEAAEGLQVLAV